MNAPILKIVPSNVSGQMIEFLNRRACINVYVYNNNGNIQIDTHVLYGENYEITASAGAIYINVNTQTTNFVYATCDCAIEAVESVPE